VPAVNADNAKIPRSTGTLETTSTMASKLGA
jgi:hypothetical protein